MEVGIRMNNRNGMIGEAGKEGKWLKNARKIRTENIKHER